jgi:hypothetical protein
MHYAIIEARQTEVGPCSERFVLAYRNEQSLHDVIAGPRIIAVGFSSRDEAAASNTACVSAAPSKQVSRATVVDRVEKRQYGFHWTERRRETGSALQRLGGFLATAAIRMALSISA